MLAELRRKRILHEVSDRGIVQVQDLADLLGVSPMTIRRDLAELDEQGLLNRVHGGAESTASAREPAYADKRGLRAEEKAAVARAAADRVRPGQSLGFSAGSTCARVAQELVSRGATGPLAGGTTVVTNALPVAEEFFRAAESRPSDAPGPRVLLSGGERTPSDALVGPLADTSLAQLHVDLLFIGAHGAGPGGLTTPNLDEARTNRALIAAAHRTVAVWDSSKWGTTGLALFASWTDIDTVITTEGLPDEALALLEEYVSEVVVAS